MKDRSDHRRKRLTRSLVAILTGAGCVAAVQPERENDRVTETEPTVTAIPANPQRLGDPDAGRHYILYGDYIGAGFPAELWGLANAFQPQPEPLLEREGPAGRLPFGLNHFESPEGVDVVSGANCLACHASVFEGELVIGLGNASADWTGQAGFPTESLKALGAVMYTPDSPKKKVLDRFLRGVEALTGQIETPFMGVNPAFRIEEMAASHRNPSDLSWTDEQVFEPIAEYTASDTPPWWNVRKKHALYANGMGRGDFRRLLQQIMVVGIDDKRHAAEIDAHMDDVLAFLFSLEPPAYPRPIEPTLAAEGRTLFESNCASCHGTYGASWEDPEPEWTYPNKLVPTDIVGTDPVYAQDLARSGLWRWYNRSWFVEAAPDAESYNDPPEAYIAPPLDGVWITAPYLHNGSVPDLAGLLDSRKRPDYWKRSFQSDDYDHRTLGWRYQPLDEPDGDPKTYDTSVRGYSNQGHTYGDTLNDAERRAVLEYLKSL